MFAGSHKQKMEKQKALAEADKANEKAMVSQLPDVILVHIFQYLDTLTLVSASLVCRRWYHVCGDNSLTATFDMRTSPRSLKQLWMISRRKLTKNTVAVHIRGKSNFNKTMENLTEAYLEDLFKRCDKLNSLSFECFDFTKVPLANIVHAQSEGLIHLSLRESMLPMKWFEGLERGSLLPNLKTLDLHTCSKVANNDLQAISYLKQLEKLVLCNCYRISARGIPTLVTNLRNLKHLDFSGCPGINNVALFHLAKLELTELLLRFCHLLTDYGINELFRDTACTRKTLRKLDLYSCHELTDKCFENVIKGNQLTDLNVGGCIKLTKEKVECFKELFPECVLQNGVVSADDDDDKCDKDENDFHACKRMRISAN